MLAPGGDSHFDDVLDSFRDECEMGLHGLAEKLLQLRDLLVCVLLDGFAGLDVTERDPALLRPEPLIRQPADRDPGPPGCHLDGAAVPLAPVDAHPPVMREE